MEWIDLYVQEVGQRLPASSREDIEKEIRSLIEDALEDESQVQGRQPDDDMIFQVLKRFGSPEKVAASYQPARYLIGPRLFPHFITTAKIVLSVILILSAVGLGVSLGWSARLPSDFARILGETALGLFQSIFQVLGIIVLIFVLVEHFNPDFKLTEEAWDPRKMKPVTDEDRVKPASQIGEIIATILILVLLNLYPQWVGFSVMRDGTWVHAPLLTSAFFQYLPWLSLLWSLEIALNIVLLARGTWQPATRWAAIGIHILTIALGVAMLAGPAIFALDPASFNQLGWGVLDPATTQINSISLANAARIVIGIIIASQLIDIGQHFYRMFLRSRIPVTVS